MAALRLVSALPCKHLASRYASPRTLIASRGLATAKSPSSLFAALDTFPDRHIGPDDGEASLMLSKLGYESMDAFVQETVPPQIRVPATSMTDEVIGSLSEAELNRRAKQLGAANKPFKSYIGMGYHNAVVPPVILRNVSLPDLRVIFAMSDTFFKGYGESCLVYSIHAVPTGNRSGYALLWSYNGAPLYSFSSGRLESLVNFQTMIMSLTSMHIANASLLDEATAAAEGMVMAFVSSGQKKKTFLVDSNVSAQTLSVLRTRAKGYGIGLTVGDMTSSLEDEALRATLCGVLVQYPDVNGSIKDYSKVAEVVHASGGLVVVASDLLALTMLKPPGEWGADIVLGNSGRFGVPAGYGGPHGAFFACTEKLKRKMPGRLIGRSRDVTGQPAYRLALQSEFS